MSQNPPKHGFDAYWHVPHGSNWEDLCTLWWGKQAIEKDDLGSTAIGTQLGETHRLLVLDEYPLLYQRIVDWQKCRPAGGALVVGQPSTGKSFFMLYFLIRLLMHKTDVLFTSQGQTMLFYQGHVYEPSDLSVGTIPAGVVWSLNDTEAEPSHVIVHRSLFPVQASSLQTEHFRYWVKERNMTCLRFIMPLRTREELINVIKLNSDYDELREALLCALFPQPGTVTAANGLARSQISLTIKKAFDLSTRLSLRGRPLADIDDVIQALVDDAITEWGSSARDVVRAIYFPCNVKKRHVEIHRVTKASLAQLGTILGNEEMYTMNSELSDTVLAVSRLFVRDQHLTVLDDNFSVRFRSVRIAQSVMEFMVMLEEKRIQDLFCVYHHDPGPSALASWTFGMFAHRMMCRSEPNTLPRVEMSLETSNSSLKAHKFTATLPQNSSPASSNPYPTRTFRIINIYDFLENPGPLYTHAYYVLDAADSDDELFDGFFVEVTKPLVSEDQICITLTLLKTTTSLVQSGGSARGYDTIQRLLDIVVLQVESGQLTRKYPDLGTITPLEVEAEARATKKRRLDYGLEAPPQVTTRVNFIYVCPYQLGEEVVWDMPEGWDVLQNYIVDPSRVSCQPIWVPKPNLFQSR